MRYQPILLLRLNPHLFIKLVKIGWSAAQLAELFHCSEKTIRNYAAQHTLSVRRRNVYDRLHEAINYDAVVNYDELAIYARCSTEFIEMYLSGKFERQVSPSVQYRDLQTIRTHHARHPVDSSGGTSE